MLRTETFHTFFGILRWYELQKTNRRRTQQHRYNKVRNTSSQMIRQNNLSRLSKPLDLEVKLKVSEQKLCVLTLQQVQQVKVEPVLSDNFGNFLKQVIWQSGHSTQRSAGCAEVRNLEKLGKVLSQALFFHFSHNYTLTHTFCHQHLAIYAVCKNHCMETGCLPRLQMWPYRTEAQWGRYYYWLEWWPNGQNMDNFRL